MTLSFNGAFRRTLAAAQTQSKAHTAQSAQDLVRKTLAQHGISYDLPGVSGTRTMQRASAAAAPTARATFTSPEGTREYVLHIPREKPKGLVLMLHGCTQTPEDFALGTQMNAQADLHDLLVVYPAQNRGANAQSCWNWFSPNDQKAEGGEPALLASLTRQIAAEHAIPDGKMFVAGLSAGAAMAVILGQTHPSVFAGVGAHSGLPFGCARSVPQAFSAMAGQGTVGDAILTPVPTIVFHGTADQTVHPGNGMQIVKDAIAGSAAREEASSATVGSRKIEKRTALAADDGILAEHWVVHGLGHAWSGGNPSGSYADAQGPDASAEMIRFFMKVSG